MEGLTKKLQDYSFDVKDMERRVNMVEYMTPGVYSEELDSGQQNMMGVGTICTGFIGVVEKVPCNDGPVLIYNMEDFKKYFGGYLSEEQYGNMRYLPYAVESFFINGGSICYIMGGCYKGNISPVEFYTSLIAAFDKISHVSIMVAPGITDKDVQRALVRHCEEHRNRFAILDMPYDAKDLLELEAFRQNINSSYAAMYHPWLQCFDPLSKRNTYFPPSGSIAGIYVRTDLERGVHKAPANETVKGCTGLSVNYNEVEQSKLNPQGINLIRALPGQGIRVWGARTCSNEGNWKYINVRRLFIYIEESIESATDWVIFEQNDEALWPRVEMSIRVFLTTLWRNGALSGYSEEEAFFVNVGRNSMTDDDISNRRLVCLVGVAVARPGEFITLRITKKTAG